MALCTRCGHQTGPDAEFCIACGGYMHDSSSVGAHSGAAERAVYLPSGSYGVPSPPHYPPAWADDQDSIDPPWYQPPDRSQFGSQQPTTGSAVAQSAPGPSAGGGRDRSSAGRRDLSSEPSRAAGSMHSGRWIAIAASIVVVCVAAAVAVVLVGHHGTVGHAAQAGAAKTGHGKPTPTPTASAAASAPQAADNGVVTVDPSAATAPHEAAVVAVLNRYFSAINSHAYSAYEKLFSPAVRSGLSAATFMTGYGTTRDSLATLHSIGVIGPGQVGALVTFTSHQQAADSPTQSSCTAWRISLYLIRQGHRYLLEAPPQGYQASYHSCS